MTDLVNAYLVIKFHGDYSNKIRIEHILHSIAESGCQGQCVACDDEPFVKHHYWASDLMKKALSAIDAAQMVIVDATEKGVGVGIEAGYAFAKGIPIITIAEDGVHISDTLCGISAVIGNYTTPESLRDLLMETIKQVLDASRVNCDGKESS